MEKPSVEPFDPRDKTSPSRMDLLPAAARHAHHDLRIPALLRNLGDRALPFLQELPVLFRIRHSPGKPTRHPHDGDRFLRIRLPAPVTARFPTHSLLKQLCPEILDQ